MREKQRAILSYLDALEVRYLPVAILANNHQDNSHPHFEQSRFAGFESVILTLQDIQTAHSRVGQH